MRLSSVAASEVGEKPKLSILLGREGFLARDSRIVERKKAGLKKARNAPQWAKR
jgi:small subunit ribosomal protein S9